MTTNGTVGARRAAVAGVILAASCGGDAPPVPAPDPQSAEAGRGALADLRALGYAGWDPIADEPREVNPPLVERGDTPDRRPWAGDRLFADDRQTVYAVDVAGEVTEALVVPHRTQVEFARPLPGGRTLTLSVDEGIDLFEADGTHLWSLDLAAHHEAVEVPRKGAAPGARLFAIATHQSRPFRGRSVRFDSVVFVEEATGRVTDSPDFPTWSTWEHREALDAAAARGEHPLSVEAPSGTVSAEPEPTYDYFHLNGLAFDGSGEMVVCLRNVSLVAGCLLPSGSVSWSLEPGLLDWPHAPSFVRSPDGRRQVLVFDNGAHRGTSRVLILDPESSAISFQWSGSAERPLWSRIRGFVETLPNGNLLVTESERGRCMEVHPNGEIVWEFLNPEVRQRSSTATQARRRIYRVTARPL